MNYFCADIGGTSIKYGIYNREGQLLQQLEPDESNNTVNRNHIVEAVLKKLDRVQKECTLTGVCLSTAGVVDSDKGEVVYSGYTIPGYTGTPWKRLIKEATSLPCEVENDVNAACLGEMWKGALKGADSAVCLTVGTGIGGAVVVNGQLYRGKGLTAGEIGYMNVDGGKFQDVASTTALVQRVFARKGELVDGRQIFDLAKRGDADCVAEIDRLTEDLAGGIVNLMYLLAPEKIALGGGIMAQAEYLGPRLKAAVAEQIEAPVFGTAELVFAQLGNDAGMIGALYNFKLRQG